MLRQSHSQSAVSVTHARTKINILQHKRRVAKFVAASRYKVCTVRNHLASHESLLYCTEHILVEICCTLEELSWQICMFVNFIGSIRAILHKNPRVTWPQAVTVVVRKIPDTHRKPPSLKSPFVVPRKSHSFVPTKTSVVVILNLQIQFLQLTCQKYSRSTMDIRPLLWSDEVQRHHRSIHRRNTAYRPTSVLRLSSEALKYLSYMKKLGARYCIMRMTPGEW